MREGASKIKRFSEFFNITLILMGSIFISSCGGKVSVENNLNSLTPAAACVQIFTCPTGYVKVPANQTVGTDCDFCVAKYEMKCTEQADGQNCALGDTAISQAANTPWAVIRQSAIPPAASAEYVCEQIDGVGTNYFLITNPEWMTIARNIETNTNFESYNWSDGSVGTGYIHRGHVDNSPTQALVASSDDGELCFGTVTAGVNPACGDAGAQQRTHTLSNGEVIWDFAGNVFQWVDWNVTPANKAYDAIDESPLSTWREWTLIDININNGDEMETITWQSQDNLLDSTNGIGQYFAGSNAIGGAALRGGSWSDGTDAGVFLLNLSNSSSFLNIRGGFRCVYRP